MSLSATLAGIVGEGGLGVQAQWNDMPLARPRTEAEAQELIALAARDQLPFVIQGRGNKLGWARLTREPKFALSTELLTGIVEFEPGDGVITALAGTPMSELMQAAESAGLAVTPNIPRPDQATLGGVIGAGQSGVDRGPRGAGRLHVLGTRALQLDGSCTKSGGRLVKNVSGYDLHRLFAGSFGSLVLLLEASLRLFPKPQEVCTLTVTSERLGELVALVPDIQASGVTPHTLLIESGTEEECWRLHAVLTGRNEPVAADRERVMRALGKNSFTRTDEAHGELRRLRDLEPHSTGGDVLHVGAPPSRLRTVFGALFDALGPHSGVRATCLPLIATIDLQVPGGNLDTERLTTLRASLRALGAQVTLRRSMPLGAEFATPVTNGAREALELRLRRTYDPQDLLCTRPPLGVGR